MPAAAMSSSSSLLRLSNFRSLTFSTGTNSTTSLAIQQLGRVVLDVADIFGLFLNLGCLGSRKRQVTKVHQRVEDHPVLSEILPSPYGVRHEHDDFTLARRHNRNRSTSLDVVRAIEKSAQH